MSIAWAQVAAGVVAVRGNYQLCVSLVLVPSTRGTAMVMMLFVLLVEAHDQSNHDSPFLYAGITDHSGMLQHTVCLCTRSLMSHARSMYVVLKAAMIQ